MPPCRTVGLFSICCFCPRVLGATFKGTFSMSAALAMVLGFIVAVGVWLMLLSIIPDGVVGM